MLAYTPYIQRSYSSTCNGLVGVSWEAPYIQRSEHLQRLYTYTFLGPSPTGSSKPAERVF
jgi:hypothetical protein